MTSTNSGMLYLIYTHHFLNPAIRSDDLSDQKSVFGRDMTQVFCSDFVVVDARDRRGLGVGAEMMWAKVNKIPVISLAPRNTHYNLDSTTLLGRRVENWTHPFVENLSVAIASNISDIAKWIKQHLSSPYQIKDKEFIDECMGYYKSTQLRLDSPMLELIENNEILKQAM